MYKFSDGLPAFGVFQSILPSQLSKHFFSVAQAVTPQMSNYTTRRVCTIHLGAKEYNLNDAQLPFYNGQKQLWTMDSNNSKEQTVHFLPELEFVDKFVKTAFASSYKEKVEKALIYILIIIFNFRLTYVIGWLGPVSLGQLLTLGNASYIGIFVLQ